MTSEKLLHYIGKIDESFIEEAAYVDTVHKETEGSLGWVKWVSAGVVATTAVAIPLLKRRKREMVPMN